MVHVSGDVNQLKNKLAFYEAQLRMKMKDCPPLSRRGRSSTRTCQTGYEQTEFTGEFSSMPQAALVTRQADPTLQDPEVLVLMAAVWELRREINRIQDKTEVS